MRFLVKLYALISSSLGFRITSTRRSRLRKKFETGRLWYQSAEFDFKIATGDHVLDIGGGPFPFPYATLLCEKYPEHSIHRKGDQKTNGLPLVVGDIEALPFESKSIDFVYTSHILEHSDDPEKACNELMRVGKRGYIETPNFMKDVLFCTANVVHHRWHTIVLENTLFFFEYSQQEREGIQSKAWEDLIWSPFYHPLQDVFEKKQRLFNTMFLWNNSFDVKVFRRSEKTK